MGSNPTPSASMPYSRSFAALRHKPQKPSIKPISVASCLWTRSPSFAIIRAVFVDRIVDSGNAHGAGDRPAHGAKGGEGKAARHVRRWGRALSAGHRDGAKNWVFRFMLNGRPRWMGMGPLHTIGLAEARKGRPSTA